MNMLTVPLSPKPRIVCAINHRGWCFESHARQLAALLYSRFDFTIVLESELTLDSRVTGDILLIFCWPFLAKVDTSRFGRVVVCLCDHWSLDAYQDPRFFAIVQEKAHAICALNQELQRRVAPYTDLPVFLTEPGIDCDHFVPQPFPESVVFGWCGNSAFAPPFARIDDGKGIKLIETAANLVGAKYLSIDAITKISIPYQDMPADFYRRITVYVCGSISEGTPNPLLEALACGRPVISTDVGLVPRAIQNGINGLIVKRNPHDIAAAMRKFLTGGLHADSMSEACRRMALQYAWQIKAAAWEHCFLSVLSLNHSG